MCQGRTGRASKCRVLPGPGRGGLERASGKGGRNQGLCWSSSTPVTCESHLNVRFGRIRRSLFAKRRSSRRLLLTKGTITSQLGDPHEPRRGPSALRGQTCPSEGSVQSLRSRVRRTPGPTRTSLVPVCLDERPTRLGRPGSRGPALRGSGALVDHQTTDGQVLSACVSF